MRVVAFLIFLLAVLILLSINEEKLNKKMKLGIAGILFAFLAFFYIYELGSNKRGAMIRELSTSFLQGETLICSGVEVSSRNFIYLENTAVFLAKQEAPDSLKGLKFDLKDCKRALK